MFEHTVFASLQRTGVIRDLSILASFLTFRVEIASFVAGVLATTLAFFVVFSELIKLFFSIVINHSSNLGLPINDHEKEGAVIWQPLRMCLSIDPTPQRAREFPC